jgi:hypothetical protein
MKIQTFNNMKGTIYGKDSKRIECDRDGILKIGDTEIVVTHGGDSILPVLFHGATGDYDATFTDENGDTYTLEKVKVRRGHIVPPSHTATEIMELRVRVDALERDIAILSGKTEDLGNIFDTNSLNFLIG